MRAVKTEVVEGIAKGATDQEFDKAWATANPMFRNDKQDAKYFLA